MFYYLFEVFVVLVLTILFIRKERPKLKYLFYGYALFILSLILQLPFKYLQILVLEVAKDKIISGVIFLFIGILISEFMKYFTLKRYLRTRSFKNAILFGIGWISLESLNFFSVFFYSYFFALFNVDFSFSFLLSKQIAFLSFVYFFVFNLAITVLVIFAVLKRKVVYLVFAILLSFFTSFGLENLVGFNKSIFQVVTFSYALFIIFHYRKLVRR